MNMPVSNAWVWLLVLLEWKKQKMMHMVTSVELKAWLAVALFNFTHRSTIYDRNLQYIRMMFQLVKLDIKRWDQPLVDDSLPFETKPAMFPQSPCAAKQTITCWQLAIPIRTTHLSHLLICKMTKQNDQSPILWCTPKHDCHTHSRSSAGSSLTSISAGLAKKKTKRKPTASHLCRRPDMVNGNWGSWLARFCPTFILPRGRLLETQNPPPAKVLLIMAFFFAFERTE